ncbi:MAG: TlpA family protein disulfide reductase, partial [Stellaceae bacterium]
VLSGLTLSQKRPVPPASDRARPSDALALTVFTEPRPVPPIRFDDAAGHPLTLADFRGRVVLLNFWATWCEPCRREMPALDRLAAKLGGADFAVVPVSIDRGGVAAVKPFYKKLGLEKLAIYVDASGKASSALALSGIPASLLIDREGREVARKMGEADWDSPQMIALVRRYLGPDAAGAKPG